MHWTLSLATRFVKDHTLFRYAATSLPNCKWTCWVFSPGRIRLCLGSGSSSDPAREVELAPCEDRCPPFEVRRSGRTLSTSLGDQGRKCIDHAGFDATGGLIAPGKIPSADTGPMRFTPGLETGRYSVYLTQKWYPQIVFSIIRISAAASSPLFGSKTMKKVMNGY